MDLSPVTRLDSSVTAITVGEVLVTGQPVCDALHLATAYWLDVFHDGPSDAFLAGGRREGTTVVPVAAKVNALKQTFDTYGAGPFVNGFEY